VRGRQLLIVAVCLCPPIPAAAAREAADPTPSVEQGLNDGLKALSTRLESLHIEASTLDISAFETIGPRPHLTSLGVFPGPLVTGCLDPLAHLTALQELRLVLGTIKQAEALAALTALTALTSLNIKPLTWLPFSVLAQVCGAALAIAVLLPALALCHRCALESKHA
jgi:hypothetical protein